MSVFALWATSEVRHQGAADLIGQREQPLAASLAGDDDKLTLGPPEVVDLKCSDLASAQAQTGQKQQHCAVADDNVGLGFAKRQHALDFLDGECLG